MERGSFSTGIAELEKVGFWMNKPAPKEIRLERKRN